jgi:hypothetical protein
MKNNRFTVSMDDVEEGCFGICIACGEMAEQIEPDGRGIECECCKKNKVYGLEEALMMGFIDIE